MTGDSPKIISSPVKVTCLTRKCTCPELLNKTFFKSWTVDDSTLQKQVSHCEQYNFRDIICKLSLKLEEIKMKVLVHVYLFELHATDQNILFFFIISRLRYKGCWCYNC